MYLQFSLVLSRVLVNAFWIFEDFFICTIFKVLIEFVTILLLFYIWVFLPRGMWTLSSSSRYLTHTPCIREGKVLTTGPPGKSLVNILKIAFINLVLSSTSKKMPKHQPSEILHFLNSKTHVFFFFHILTFLETKCTFNTMSLPLPPSLS